MTYNTRQLSLLDECLTEYFTTDELARFVEQIAGPAICAELPGLSTSRATFAFDSVRLLARHGMLDARFFIALERLRPHRRGALRRLAAGLLAHPLDEVESETLVWDGKQAKDARRLMWVDALEDALLGRDRLRDDANWAEHTRKISDLARHVRAIPHVGPGSIVSGTRLERPIGTGNFGTVWYALHLASGQPVATKVFNLDRCTDELMLWRFRRSIRALHHMGSFRDVPRTICGLIEASDDRLAFCMPYMREGNLEQVERRGWSNTTKLAVFLEVCRAVAFAHKSGVVHRDIKPANILLDGDHRPVLIDFDISDIRFVTELAGDQAGVGTPVFAAPEQLERADAADERSDVYSLGRLLYFLLLERSPGFQRENDPQLENLRGFSPALVAVVRRATQADPARRFSSVDQVIAAVERHHTGRAALKARLAAARRWVRQHVILMTAGILCMIASLSLNYFQDRMVTERNRFLNEGAEILEREAILRTQVHQQVIELGEFTRRLSALEITASTDDGCCDLATRVASTIREFRGTILTMQGDMLGVLDEIEAEESKLRYVLAQEQGPTVSPAPHSPVAEDDRVGAILGDGEVSSDEPESNANTAASSAVQICPLDVSPSPQALEEPTGGKPRPSRNSRARQLGSAPEPPPRAGGDEYAAFKRRLTDCRRQSPYDRDPRPVDVRVTVEPGRAPEFELPVELGDSATKCIFSEIRNYRFPESKKREKYALSIALPGPR